MEANEAAGDRAQAHPLVLGQVGQVHRALDAPVLVLLDEQDVDDPDHAALPDATQLGEDPAGCLELVEPDHEHLAGSGDALLDHPQRGEAHRRDSRAGDRCASIPDPDQGAQAHEHENQQDRDEDRPRADLADERLPVGRDPGDDRDVQGEV